MARATPRCYARRVERAVPVQRQDPIAVDRTGPREAQQWSDEQFRVGQAILRRPGHAADGGGRHLARREHHLHGRHRLQPANAEAGALQARAPDASEELHATNEELEITNEELHSTVEELETTNEELQSSNEELETMNEELESTNAELQAINTELQLRGVQIDQVNDFMKQIMANLEFGVASSTATCASSSGTGAPKTCGASAPMKRSVSPSSASISAFPWPSWPSRFVRCLPGRTAAANFGWRQPTGAAGHSPAGCRFRPCRPWMESAGSSSSWRRSARQSLDRRRLLVNTH